MNSGNVVECDGEGTICRASRQGAPGRHAPWRHVTCRVDQADTGGLPGYRIGHEIGGARAVWWVRGSRSAW